MPQILLLTIDVAYQFLHLIPGLLPLHCINLLKDFDLGKSTTNVHHILFLVFWRSSVEDSSSIKTPPLAPKIGSVLSVQCCSAHSSHVHVWFACPLDGMCLVLHWAERDWSQWNWLPNWWVTKTKEWRIFKALD